jgi:ribosomal protein S18 acetylase RimI-like enzyme
LTSRTIHSAFTPPAIELPAALVSAGVGLRAATPADAAFERALFETARPDAVLLAAWPEAMRKPFLDQQFGFQSVHYARIYPHAFRGIVEAKGEAIGRIILDCTGKDWCVVDIALMPPWRRLGLGEALLRATQVAAAQGGAALVLTVEATNPARRLYERIGFSVTEETEPSVVMAWCPA